MRAFWNRKYCSILFLGLVIAGCLPARLSSQTTDISSDSRNAGTLQPARADVSPEQIFAELMRRNEIRNGALRSYTVERSYAVTDQKGKVHAQKAVRLDYRAPDTKSFVTISEKGSPVVRHLVLNRLMESETEA